MAYDEDLRQRVIAFVKGGGSKSEAARRFTVCRETVYKWLRLPEDNLSPQKTGPKGPTKVDTAALARLVNEQPDRYLDEYAAALHVSRFAISYGFKKLGISRKKNHAVQRAKRKSTTTI